MINVVAVTANIIIALAYVAIGLYIAPKFQFQGPALGAKLARVAGLAFFILCAATHTEMAVHAATAGPEDGVGDWFTSWHGLAIHTGQAVAGWVFLVVAAKYLMVNISNKKIYDAVMEERYREIEEGVKVRFSSSPIVPEAEWPAMLKTAVEGRAIRAVFQPIVNLSNGKAVGYEALTRFSGHYSPEGWFTAASLYGGQEDLELAAIRCALQNSDLLSGAKYLSLNVSQATLVDPRLEQTLREHGHAHRVVLELTEQLSVVRFRDVNASMLPFRRLGIRIAVDDVGSGFAGLRRIVELEPELIKIDRSLTRTLDEDGEHGAAMVRALMQFSNEMNCVVVLEGIETEEQLRVAKHLGVRFGQGYLLGRPVPAVELSDGGDHPIR